MRAHHESAGPAAAEVLWCSQRARTYTCGPDTPTARVKIPDVAESHF
ncbi:hypothetical protein SSCG_03678 [Streptomyces clavuligerus]|nr:hypothetical protein SSCG_03678 [Streptomyces clavuligerus]